MEVEVLPFIVVNMYVVPNQEFNQSIQQMDEGMVGLDLSNLDHYQEDQPKFFQPNDPYDDLEDDLKMNESNNDVDDDQNLILHNMELLMQQLMDHRLDELL